MNDEPSAAVDPRPAEAPSGEDSPPKSPARRRRSRGGRGRGGGNRTPVSAGESGAKEDAAPDQDAPVKPKQPQRRRPPAKPKPETRPEAGGEPSEPAKPKPRSPQRRRPAKPKPEDAKAGPGEAQDDRQAEEGEETSTPKPAARRRRRGGRGRSGKKPVGAASEAKDETEAKSEAAPISTRRAARSARSSSGSRTRSGGGRRRESLPPVHRVQGKLMVITEHGERDQIAVLEDRDLVQHYITRVGAHSMVGNIYMARVQNVLPGMEAAFLDIGRGRNAVLYAGEVNYDEEVEGSPPQRIEQALKPGQSVMVQVTKDPLGGKGARLTAQVSLPGRYLVLVPDSQVFGISRRLADNERRRLRAAIKKVMPEGHGIIVRTAADGASEEDLAADVDRLVKEWGEIAKKAKKAKAPAVLYEEPELTVRVVRDLFNGEEFKEMVTDSPRIHEIVTAYLRDVAPDLLEKTRLHQGSLPAFEEFHIVEQIHKALDRKVWLPSGGYLIIDRTEALTVIDVNSGKFVGKTNLEETVVKTNLEAADEVARQLRLRDIGGMIIIDFIDMLLEPNKKKVIQTLKEALAQDKTRSQVFDISPLGLLEMTRKRVSAGLLESFSETCPTCEGRGILLTLEI